MATKAAVNTFQRVYADPVGETTRGAFESRAARYNLLWHYYQNSAFEDARLWQAYKAKYGLYRQTRSIYNPARRLVDFYAGIVYPGVLSADAARLPDNTPLAIPLAEDINPALAAAIGQVWRWSNWQAAMRVMVRYGAALGDVAVELVDDVDAGKVVCVVRWPGQIADLTLDDMGNVKGYALEYDYEEADGQRYTYRKEVDQESIRTYRNGQPWLYDGVPAEVANPYGFAPLVWAKHTDIGGDHGEPALRNIAKWDELNMLASAVHDHAMKVLHAPLLITGENIGKLGEEQTKRLPTPDLTNPYGDRESLNLLKAASGGDIRAATLPQGDALALIDRDIAEIEHDHPEIGMYTKLREMAQVTGPGAERMFGDVRTYVDEARGNYDLQSVKLFQMAVAIGGWRLSRGDGGWAQRTRQQEALDGFDLTSYARGELDFEIMPRPLVPPIPERQADATVVKTEVDAGIPLKTALRRQGWSEKELAQLEEDAAAEKSAGADLATAYLAAAETNASRQGGMAQPGAMNMMTQNGGGMMSNAVS